MKKAYQILWAFTVIFFLAHCKREACKEEIKSNCVATREYFPVCGCNGKTYSNPSVAACYGITEYTQGSCE